MSESGTNGEPTRVVLVRHGESEWHAENRYAGSSDIGMTDRGHDQAADLATWARAARPDAVWSSPQTRAHQTALPSSAALGLAPVVDARLRELDFGVAEGLTRDEMREEFPDDLEAFVDDPVRGRFPGGEDPSDAITRFTACLADVAERHPGGRVLVVAHSTVVRLVLCSLLGIDPARYRDVMPGLGNCTLTEVALRSRARAALLTYNAPPLETVVAAGRGPGGSR